MATLARWQGTIVDESGNIVPLANIEVRRESSGAPLVQLYSDRDGSTSIGNPFTATAEGFAAFHVSGGAYKIRAYLNGFERIWRYVPIGTNAELDFCSPFNPRGPWIGDPETKTALATSGTVAVNENLGTAGIDDIAHFRLAFSATFTQQLPTNVIVGEKYDVLYVSANASAVPAFSPGHSGIPASFIRKTLGARTRLRFTVTAVSGTTATAVTVEKVTFSTDDLVEDGGRWFVSNVDSNDQEPVAGTSTAYWTAYPDLPTNAVTSESITQIIVLTQSEYDALGTPNPAILYLISE